MMETAAHIRQLAKDYYQEVVQIRRHFHRYPELSMQEFATADFIAALLSSWGIPFRQGVAKTGLVATIKGELGKGKTLALRADMDALAIQENNHSDYASQTPGVMHACGHDVHLASLLGCMKILMQLRGSFAGEVRCLFQPSEETFPGGASLMIAEGVLDNPVPAGIFGQHVLPELEAGMVGMAAGRYMASTDEVHLLVKGRGGHAATPELLVDPVLISAHIILALQQIVSRKAKATTPTVLSFGFVEAAGQTNVIPDHVTLKGTFRTFDEDWRLEAHRQIIRIAEAIAQGMGGSCQVEVRKGYPALVNDDALTWRSMENARSYLGPDHVRELDMRMTAEDFAYYGQIVPACFYRLGTRNEAKGIVATLHSPAFDVDERALETGMGLMAWLTYKELMA